MRMSGEDGRERGREGCPRKGNSARSYIHSVVHKHMASHNAVQAHIRTGLMAEMAMAEEGGRGNGFRLCSAA